jgi:hypothetical protein
MEVLIMAMTTPRIALYFLLQETLVGFFESHYLVSLQTSLGEASQALLCCL